jgi:hypothetical protein
VAQEFVMGRTSEDEANEQKSNEHLQGDHHRRAQKVDEHVSDGDADGKPGPAPDDRQGGVQQGGSKGR